MPHPRARYIEPLILKALKHSPIVGILGQRQTGKTTLLKRLAKDYVTLDRRDVLDLAQSDPHRFIEAHASPFGIDECQLEPSLFPALKDSVRLQPAKGRFLLSGSVRFTSRKAIRESLTGRIFNLEILPFSLSEAEGRPLPDGLLKWTPVDEPHAVKGTFEKKLSDTLQSGGLPGICFFRELAVRKQLFATHLETLLERDLKLLLQTTIPFSSLRALTELLALSQGEPVEIAGLARKSGISSRTVKNLLSAMEGLFLIRQVRQEGSGSKAPVFFFEDQGQATFLAQNRFGELQQHVRLLYAQLIPQFHYRPELNSVFFQYRSRGGAIVPLAWRTEKQIIGVIPSLDETPSRSAIQSALSFVRANGHGAKVAIIHPGKSMRRIAPMIGTLPIALVV
jgi:predicted AAA+ superfamily ATPase